MILGIEQTDDTKEIKRAYAKKAKLYRPEEEPEKFSQLHDAMLSALSYAQGSRGDKESMRKNAHSINDKNMSST